MTNTTAEHRSLFEGPVSGNYGNIVPLSFFLYGQRAFANVAVDRRK